ncbi:MAG: transposase [Micromonosporaceae bacterium]
MARFKSFVGLTPRASETETDRKGQPMSKAGPSLLRATFVRAADTARKQDPQLARIYYPPRGHAACPKTSEATTITALIGEVLTHRLP